jgi:transcriptional regulator
MYLPRHFEIDDVDRIVEFVDTVGSADIVTFDGERLISSLVPVIWDRSVGEHGRLLAHLSIANDQWRTTRTDVGALAIVRGPEAYISPSWYPSKLEHGRAVPTWNYVAVHFTGPVVFHPESEWLRDIVTRLTDKHEADRADRWHVTDAPDSYIEGQLRGIVGVELLIERVEAKAKLSQNRSEADQAGAVDGLRGDATHGAAEVADLMERRAFS